MDTEPVKKVLHVLNQINELSRIEVFLPELADEWGLPQSLILSVNLVLEEVFTNIVSYGYNDKNNHIISIEFEKESDELKISVIDDGIAYDPTLKEDPDITLSAADRPVGGLGIYLIKQIMDKVEYKRIGEKNHLILTKRNEDELSGDI
jgi:serine/threonine-protein kinase RsbW